MGLAFFGLTPSYKLQVYQEIHDLVFHGNGGFIHSEVYNMPIWMRRWHIKQIDEFNKGQNQKMEDAMKRSQNTSKGYATGPNI